jgi:phytoene desaturase
LEKAIVIGSGFAGLSTAAFLAKAGYKVKILEKNTTTGGRARVFKAKGYTFDMGPSWYWMPEIFEKFFNEFNHCTDDFYKLIQLDPGFKIVFRNKDIDIPSNWDEICQVFDNHEKNGSDKLKLFMKDAEEKYNIGLEFLYNSPGLSITELFRKNIIKNINKLEILTTYRQHIKKYFKNSYLINILEFPVLFLGTAANNTPALYSLMAYSGIKQGTFYPMGGFNEVIKGMEKICQKYGVEIATNQEVQKINITNNKVTSVTTINKIIKTDLLIGTDRKKIQKLFRCILEIKKILTLCINLLFRS